MGIFGESRLSDEWIVRQVRSGRREDFARLVRRHLPAVYGLAYARLGHRADAENVALETFLRVYETLDRLPEGEWFLRRLAVLALSLSRNPESIPRRDTSNEQ